jgi:LuxR family maltose regulon positive regulatory protein
MLETTLPLDLTYPAVPTGLLLTTKLYVPRLRASRVWRPRLVARLRQDLDQRKLTLISAPTGFGKTTLLSEWLFQKDEGERMKDESFLHPSSLILHPSKVAWLSLDKDDNDLVRFLTYVIAALQTVHPALGETTLAMLHPAQSFPLEAMLIPLLNDLVALPEESVLVLDDYHVIEIENIHQAVTFLLDHLPPHLHLMILSRTTPPLPLGHLRARGQLLELHAADLRFTPAEAAEFLNQVMGLNLSKADIELLETRTEGWIAGLQLAALSMQGRDAQDIPGFLASFSGSHPYILDYLAEEVLQRQPEPIQAFLLQTSILDRLCGPLCDAILSDFRLPILNFGLEAKNTFENRKSKIENSQRVLEYLEQSNLFIVPLDDERHWYRYHHLFAELLRNFLQKKVGTSGVTGLHRRAAAWFEQQGLVAEAMSHALAAADVERAARLVEQHAQTLFSRSEMTTLLSWLDALPAELIRSQPQLSLFQAWALALTGQFEAAETALPESERQPGEVAAIRATVAYLRRNMPRAIALYGQALETLPEENSFLRGAVALSLGIAYSWTGQVTQAGQALSQASAISRASGNLHVALTAMWNLAQLQIEQGHLRRAVELCRQALELAETDRQGDQGLPPAAGGAYVSLGALLYEQNDLEGAAAQLEAGIKLGEQGADLAILALGYLALARIKRAQADPKGALELANQAEQLARRYNSPYWTAQAAAYQARLWLAEGQLEGVVRWAQEYQLSAANEVNYLYEAEYLTLARLLLAQGKWAEAVALLERLRQAAGAGQRLGRVLEVLILEALAYQAQSAPGQALVCLQQALTLAEPEGYVRLFLDEGQPIIMLFAAAGDDLPAPHQAYVDSLLAAHRREQEKILHPSSLRLQPLIEPLSERELEILSLIAAGMSNGEIAEKLVVTVGTVKWHLNNIYGKLGVRSRTQAAAKVRELGLL